ncbi:MAG: phosphatidate cytidylyltransferase [Planctomycetota bacterium]|jgi:phosphatidate cytidylyltransferase|nr:phosphatidate cytidylyltransferase [Planctomycetota bacterium]
MEQKRKIGNLVLRAVSALAALAVSYGCLRWDVVHSSGWAWAGLTAVFSLFCLREFFRLAVSCDIQPFPILGFVCGPLWILFQEWELSGESAGVIAVSPSWLLFLVAATAAMLLQLTRRSNDNALVNVAVTMLGILYCSVLPGLSVHFRHMRLGEQGWPMHGVEFVIVCIFITKVSDVGALLVGSSWGKRKLIPRLSPGKTWEGAIGGLVFSVFLLQFMVFTSPWMALARLGWAKLALLSVLLAAAGLAGDLIESAFKRNSRRKDAGTGVPGFGGVLDLTDSLIVASPAFYFFLLVCGAEYVKATG